MKINILAAILLVVLVNAADAQEKGNSSFKGISLHGTILSSNGLTHFVPVACGIDAAGDGYYDLGISYVAQLGRRWSLESGLSYASNKLIITPSFSSENTDPFSREYTLVEIPVYFQLNGKYLFLNMGTMIGFDLDKEPYRDSQGGLGLMVGCGAQFRLAGSWLLYANPFVKSNALINFQGDQARLVQSGFRVGITKLFGE